MLHMITAGMSLCELLLHPSYRREIRGQRINVIGFSFLQRMFYVTRT